MNWLDPIKELYNMYSKEEDTPNIVKVVDNKLEVDSNLENRPVNPYFQL